MPVGGGVTSHVLWTVYTFRLSVYRMFQLRKRISECHKVRKVARESSSLVLVCVNKRYGLNLAHEIVSPRMQ